MNKMVSATTSLRKAVAPVEGYFRYHWRNSDASWHEFKTGPMKVDGKSYKTHDEWRAQNTNESYDYVHKVIRAGMCVAGGMVGWKLAMHWAEADDEDDVFFDVMRGMTLTSICAGFGMVAGHFNPRTLPAIACGTAFTVLFKVQLEARTRRKREKDHAEYIEYLEKCAAERSKPGYTSFDDYRSRNRRYRNYYDDY